MADLKGKATLDTTPFEKGLDKMQAGAKKAAEGVKSGFGSLVAPISALGAAVAAAFAGGAIAGGVADVYNLGGALSEMSDQTGISVKNLVILRKNFTDAGLEAEDLGKSVGKMQKFLEEALSDDKKISLIQELGLSFADLRKMKPEEQFYAIGRALSGIESASERNTKAMELFGKAGAKLNVVFQDDQFGRVSAKLSAQAELLSRNAKIFDEISDRLSGPSGVLKTFYAGVADALGPVLLATLKEINKIDLTKLGQSFGDALVSAFQTVLTISKAILELPWKEIFVGIGGIFLSIWEDVKSIVSWIADKLSGVMGVAGKLLGLGGGGGKGDAPSPSLKLPGALAGLGALFGGGSSSTGNGDDPANVTVGGKAPPKPYMPPALTTNERRAILIRDAKARNPTATANEINAEVAKGMQAQNKRDLEDKIRARRNTSQGSGFDEFFKGPKKDFFDGKLNTGTEFDRRFNPQMYDKRPQIGAGGKEEDKRSAMQQLIDAIVTVGQTISDSNKELVAR